MVHQDLHVDARQILGLGCRVERGTDHEGKEANDQDEHEYQLDYVRGHLWAFATFSKT